jgi:hypothetical protein
MILRIALRSLLVHPVRSAVLACGFGLGVAVMAILLGVGQVVLEQARSPQLAGGGDVVITGAAGPVTSARFLLSAVLQQSPLAERVEAASPASRTTLYLVQGEGTRAVRVRGGIPSLERALGDPETSAIAAWRDKAADERWANPSPGEVLRAMDRFRPIPDVPERAGSWAEWLYFNGRAGGTRFYLAFLAGPESAPGRRRASVRLQLDHDGRMTSYAASGEIDEERLLADAPDLEIAGNRVTLEGLRYRIRLDLPFAAEPTGGMGGDITSVQADRLCIPDDPTLRLSGITRQPGVGGPSRQPGRVTGEIVLDAVHGRSLPPITVRGTGGWVSGYTVPVMSGRLGGALTIHQRVGPALRETREARISLEGGAGYHDHNWGFWEGVTWHWGQVQHEDISFVYGRVFPPADAADPERLPAFLVALGADGPLGHSTSVSIEETMDPATGYPHRVLVKGRSPSLDLDMELAIEDAIAIRMGDRLFGAGMDFLQLRARYAVSGRAGDRLFNFTAPGAAETFRGP